ncbi:dihydrofolate reductase family protein [Hymenobacter coalescens]
MRKLKLQVQLTIDGFMCGPQGEMDWMACPWPADLDQYVTALTAPVDTIVLGRKLAEGFIPHWAAAAADTSNPEEAAAGRKFTDTPKVVFSRTLPESPWPRTSLAAHDLVAEITRLKQQPGGDIMAYGGATFVAELIRHGLVDEYHLLVNPTAIGHGRSPFGQPTQHLPLRLVKAISFSGGLMVQHYEPQRS